MGSETEKTSLPVQGLSSGGFPGGVGLSAAQERRDPGGTFRGSLEGRGTIQPDRPSPPPSRPPPEDPPADRGDRGLHPDAVVLSSWRKKGEGHPRGPFGAIPRGIRIRSPRILRPRNDRRGRKRDADRRVSDHGLRQPSPIHDVYHRENGNSLSHDVCP